MKKFALIFSVMLVSSVLIACQAKEQIVVVTATPEPTTTPEPTAIPSPTLTPTPEPTPTPLGQIFHDDFNQTLQPGWMWLNENSKNWGIIEQGWLRIKSEDLCLLNEHFQNNLLMLSAPVEGNFEIVTLVDANTTGNFQQASIYIFEDEGNYFSINRGYCDLCPTKGNGIFSDYMYKNKWPSFNGRSIDTDKVYLRIVVNRDKKEMITYYAVEPDKWIQLRKVPLVIAINQVGLGSSNCDQGENSENLVTLFDYFEISALD